MKFYDIAGNEICIEKWLATFEPCYYLPDEKGVPKHKSITNVSVNSKISEDIIVSILHNGIKRQDDVDRIFAWKIGGIDHKGTKENGQIKFIDTWERDYVKARYFSCERGRYKGICEGISKLANEFPKQEAQSADRKDLLQKIIENLDDNPQRSQNTAIAEGFGPVYIMTVLYFLTFGESPIFDRFAYTAVKAIYQGRKPTDIWYENPSSKDPDDILKVLSEYEWYLEQVFGTAKICRKIDRALWVYGHKNAIKEENGTKHSNHI